MNLLRQPARPLARAQPPLMHQYWLHRWLAETHTQDAPAPGTESPTTESGEATPDDQT